MNDIIGLDANVSTALAVIVTGVLVPVITSLLKHPKLPKSARRLIPIGLAAVGALLIVLFRAGGQFAEQATTWVLLLATLVGIGQALYAVMPKAWLALEESTTPAGARRDERSAFPGTNTPDPVLAHPEENLSPQSGLESSEGETPSEKYRQRTLNQPEGEDYTRG